MKNVIITTAAAFFLALVSSSCKTLVPYTYALEQKYNLQDHRDRIQFYSSTDVELQKNLDSVSAYIAHGKIKTVGDKKVEVIRIKAGTKGAKISDEPSKIYTGFEKSDAYFLAFGPNPNTGGKYSILAHNWQGNIGTVDYGSEEYKLIQGKECVLLVDMRKILNFHKKSRTAKGRKVK